MSMPYKCYLCGSIAVHTNEEGVCRRCEDLICLAFEAEAKQIQVPEFKPNKFFAEIPRK